MSIDKHIEEASLSTEPLTQEQRKTILHKLGTVANENVYKDDYLRQAMQKMVEEDLDRAEAAVLIHDDLDRAIVLQIIDPDHWRLSYKKHSVLFNEALRRITEEWEQNSFGAWNKPDPEVSTQREIKAILESGDQSGGSPSGVNLETF